MQKNIWKNYYHLCLSLKNSKKIKIEGKEAKLYAIGIGNFEFKACPKIKYIANVIQAMPIQIGFFVLERNLSTISRR
jgi:hypothetical protein